MRITCNIKANLRIPEVQNIMKEATEKALRDVVVDIANDAAKGSPVLTGNNRRSIKFEVGPNAEVAKGDLEGAIYSTSGYGGYLETGTRRGMAARPYLKPALDRNIGNLGSLIERYLP